MTTTTNPYAAPLQDTAMPTNPAPQETAAPANPAPSFATREERDNYYRSKYFARRGGGDESLENKKLTGAPINVEMTPGMVALFMGCMKVFGAAAWLFYFTRNVFALITATVILGGILGWLTS